ncbi:MAG: NAD(P)H-quinone oxidoreductase subunit 5, partial [Lentimonas sp.]
MSSEFLPFLAPLALIAASVLAFRGAAMRPGSVLRTIQGITLVALAAAVLSSFNLITTGPTTSGLIGFAGLGISARLDAVSMVMLVLVSFIGWVVVRYAATYMDGEPQQGPFMGWLCATLAAVMMLVIAGSILQLALAWIATSLFLHKLLLHYPNRVAAQRAAHKKWITARIGDGALLFAVVLLFAQYGTGDIAEILAAARMGEGQASAGWIAAALAVAAVLKSAQFPMHGWLTEVMETPTPVSALLHAGVINAGGFLLIRFADVMLLAPGVLAILVMIGGFTALFGGLVMLTQSAVKTSLAWSTVAQMGFMMLQCGLA